MLRRETPFLHPTKPLSYHFSCFYSMIHIENPIETQILAHRAQEAGNVIHRQVTGYILLQYLLLTERHLDKTEYNKNVV